MFVRVCFYPVFGACFWQICRKGWTSSGRNSTASRNYAAIQICSAFEEFRWILRLVLVIVIQKSSKSHPKVIQKLPLHAIATDWSNICWRTCDHIFRPPLERHWWKTLSRLKASENLARVFLPTPSCWGIGFISQIRKMNENDCSAQSQSFGCHVT